ncbi:hypothetical protein GCM10023083_43720 [Streptomyces phyllanthi]
MSSSGWYWCPRPVAAGATTVTPSAGRTRPRRLPPGAETPPRRRLPPPLAHGYVDPAVYTTGRGPAREQPARNGYAVLHTDYGLLRAAPGLRQG